MRIISVYVEGGAPKAWVEQWNGDQRRSKFYQATQASLDRLADVVGLWLMEGKLWVRPFMGGCVGYVAQERDV